MSLVQHFEPNPHGRDLVVGDIHGCMEQFECVLARANFDFQRDRLFSVGDLVDRGDHSARALRLLAEPWFHVVIGNHEAMLQAAGFDPAIRWFESSPGNHLTKRRRRS